MRLVVHSHPIIEAKRLPKGAWRIIVWPLMLWIYWPEHYVRIFPWRKALR